MWNTKREREKKRLPSKKKKWKLLLSSATAKAMDEKTANDFGKKGRCIFLFIFFFNYVTEKRNCHCVLKCYFKLLFTVDYMMRERQRECVCLIYIIFFILCSRAVYASLYLCYTILSKIRCPYSNYILDCRVLVMYVICSLCVFFLFILGQCFFFSLSFILFHLLSFLLPRCCCCFCHRWTLFVAWYAVRVRRIIRVLFFFFLFAHNSIRITYIYKGKRLWKKKQTSESWVHIQPTTTTTTTSATDSTK